MENSSDTEDEDTLATANPIKSKTLFGSIGYYCDKSAGSTEYWDNFDNFSCQVAQSGTLGIEVLAADTLQFFNNVISIWRNSGTRLDYNYLSGSPRSVTVNNLDAGAHTIFGPIVPRDMAPIRSTLRGT